VRLRVLIVDDEPLACERLESMLEAEGEVQIVGTCINGRDALAALHKEVPDLIFLDVEMPEMDGFAFVQAVSPSPLPLVVITTAYEKYAVRAFEAQVVDFLLKPFDGERLRETLRHARERLHSIRALPVDERLTGLRRRLAKPTAISERISIKENGRIIFLKLQEIDWIGATDNYVELHSGQSSHLLLSTLTAFETRLPPAQFVRVSRSAIVNLSRIKELQLGRHGDGTIILQDGTEVSLSRSYRRKLDHLLGKETAEEPC